MIPIREELKRNVLEVKKEIEQLKNFDDVEEFLDYMIDVQVLVDIGIKRISGFNICRMCGGPNIYVIYDREYPRIYGCWYDVKHEISFDVKKAFLILDYLSEIWEGII